MANAAQRLKVPDGFRVSVFADGLEKPRMIAVTQDGGIYVTLRDAGQVLLLRDSDGDGKAEGGTVAATLKNVHGIAIHQNSVYLATVKEVFVGSRKADGTIGELKKIVDNLPDGGQHPNRTLGAGPDGRLYTSVGSSCNGCAETNPEHATIPRTNLDGSDRKIFSSGLRNTIGFDWHPDTKEMWGMDHGIDWLGDETQGEELNNLFDGAKYGWPYVYGMSDFNPADEPPAGITKKEWALTSREPVKLYTAHAAPMQMKFYTGGDFPPEYRENAFISMRGSWNRKPPSGYEVLRIRFRAGQPVGFQPFLTGFLSQQDGEWGVTGRPVGLAFDRSGAMLVGDEIGGVIYRITYGGAGKDSGEGN